MVIRLLLCLFTLAACENCVIPSLDVVRQGVTCRTDTTELADGQHAVTQCGILLFCISGKVSGCRSQADQSCLTIDQECPALMQDTSSSPLACTTKRERRDLRRQERARFPKRPASDRFIDLIYRRKRREGLTTSTEDTYHHDFTTVPPTTTTTATTPPVTTTTTIAADTHTTTAEDVVVRTASTTTITTPPAASTTKATTADPDTTTTEDAADADFTTVPPTSTTTSPTLLRKKLELNDEWKREEVGRLFTAVLKKRRNTFEVQKKKAENGSNHC